MKKIILIPVAILLACGLAGCTSTKVFDPVTMTVPKTSQPTNSATSSATDSPSSTPTSTPSETAEPTAATPVDTTAQDKIKIAVLYQNFYKHTQGLTTKQLNPLFDDLYKYESTRKNQPTADSLYARYVKLVPEVKYVDSTGKTEAQRVEFYERFIAIARGGQSSKPSTATVTADSITIDGNTAHITVAKIKANIAGAEVNTNFTEAKINFIKKNGQWYMKLDDGLMWDVFISVD